MTHKVYARYFEEQECAAFDAQPGGAEGYRVVLDQIFYQEPPAVPRASSCFVSTTDRDPFDGEGPSNTKNEQPPVGTYKVTLMEAHKPCYHMHLAPARRSEFNHGPADRDNRHVRVRPETDKAQWPPSAAAAERAAAVKPAGRKP